MAAAKKTAPKAKVKAAPKKPTGRPSTYTPALADTVIERVSNGEPLAAVCRALGIGLTTWYGWEVTHNLLERIARAREAGEEMIAVDALRIADTPMEGVKVKITEDGEEITKEDMLGHRKLQVETRLKLLAKWNPRKWGDKVGIGGAEDLPAIKTQNDSDLDARLAELMAKQKADAKPDAS